MRDALSAIGDHQDNGSSCARPRVARKRGQKAAGRARRDESPGSSGKAKRPLAKSVRRLDEPAQGDAGALAEAVAEAEGAALAEAVAEAVGFAEADAGFGRIRLAP
jgi:NAD+--asparagine ADP-ribosyltransferase